MEGGEGKGVAVPLLLAAGMESAGGCGARGWEWGLRSCGIAPGALFTFPWGQQGLSSRLRLGDTAGVWMALCLVGIRLSCASTPEMQPPIPLHPQGAVGMYIAVPATVAGLAVLCGFAC